jgi:hypothetical protein
MSDTEPAPEPRQVTVDRATRIRDYVEQLIALVGEHPECEVKKNWPRNTPFHRAEMVKDIQATANSVIAPMKEKYIVVGADQETRTITGCNPSDYDDASIRQLLEQYLDPVPEFEVLALKSSTGVDFVVIRFPFQDGRPIFAKAQIRGERNQIYLDVGQVWVKPGGADTGSTGKRLVSSRQELLGLINLEPMVGHEVTLRLEKLLPEIRLEERTRLGVIENNVLPVLTSTDEEFELYVEQLLVGNKINQLNVGVEKLRDRTVSVWENSLNQNDKITAEHILEVKETEFLPAMKRLTLLGLLLIKFSAPVLWFSVLVDLLVEVFAVSHRLRRAQTPSPAEISIVSLAEHQSYTVPALETLLAAYLLTAFALVIRRKYEFLRVLFPRTVQAVRGPYDPDFRGFLLFWPLTYRWGTPDIRRDLLVAERYARGDGIELLFGGGPQIKNAVLQVDCLVDWHAVLGQRPEQGETEIYEFFGSKFAGIDNSYTQNFTKESLTNVVPLIREMWEINVLGDRQLFLDEDLADIFGTFGLDRRKLTLAKFLDYGERAHGEVMWAQQRFPFRVQWQPNELDALVKTFKAAR